MLPKLRRHHRYSLYLVLDHPRPLVLNPSSAFGLRPILGLWVTSLLSRIKRKEAVARPDRAIYGRLRGSGTYGQDRLELPYAEKCLLEFSVSGPIWADDVQA